MEVELHDGQRTQHLSSHAEENGPPKSGVPRE